ncbi:uncharacterized protein F5891DRAFT_984661 [Suillus fuscotomentosus]|uniref:Uncharacterized protein n=1 Tax=Suillus fuscotomentosus TaxID=1912939 RepID=A0AAD4DVQ6_9AGAM|nr:uncharacterized protein F5891DRAFT_984661 [Suillus fuscotomentosus]KAG1894969.1 hypothetical protein F5891DRAFT_984661 [Suillus fuscotomentosus]
MPLLKRPLVVVVLLKLPVLVLRSIIAIQRMLFSPSPLFWRFELGDEILPKLHTLIATVCNTCWEENMRSPKMGLNYEQASKLNWALHADLQLGSSFRADMAKRTQGLAKPARTKNALEDTWQAIDDATIKIALEHKKSVRRVQHELHIGHSLLQLKHSKVSAWNSFIWKKGQDSNKENYGHSKYILEGITKDFKDEYYSLTEEEKANLIEDVTFATEGVQEFMESAMGIDNQDLVSKLEGLRYKACQGQQRIISSTWLKWSPETVARDSNAKMQWAQYWRNIVKWYSVIIKGWPEQIPFANLSAVSSSLPKLEMLLRKWKSGAIYWKHLTPEELEHMDKERDKGIENGAIAEKHRARGRRYIRVQRWSAADDEEENLDLTVPPADDTPGSPVISPPSNMSIPSTSNASTPPPTPDGTNTTPVLEPNFTQSANNLPFPDLTPPFTYPPSTPGSLGPAPSILPNPHPDLSLSLPPGFEDFLANFDPSLMPF